MTGLPEARWWAIRRARSLKPTSYTCPLCGVQLHAMTEHLLIAPEGDAERRRHAHRACVQKARARGELLLRDEWEARQEPAAGGHGLLGRLLARRRPRATRDDA